MSSRTGPSRNRGPGKSAAAAKATAAKAPPSKAAPSKANASVQSRPPHRTAQQRLAEQRAASAAVRIAAARRRRLTIAGAPIAVIVVIVAVLVIVKVVTGAGAPKSGIKASTAPTGVIGLVTNVPLAALNAVGVGSASAVPTAANATALTQNGLPRVLYIGAEYCPYCATERWAVVVALSRFGTFANLGQTASSPSDAYPSTATLTFHGATFTSTTIAFTGIEEQSNQVMNGQYAQLDKISAADQALVTKYDAPPYFPKSSGIPFIDIGGKYLLSGASYDPQVLQGETAAQIAAALSDPTSAIAKGVLGTANLITAAICAITSNQPAAVCQASGVVAVAAKLTSAG